MIYLSYSLNNRLIYTIKMVTSIQTIKIYLTYLPICMNSQYDIDILVGSYITCHWKILLSKSLIYLYNKLVPTF